MLQTVLITLISIILFAYSILRYYDLWKRFHIPVFFYYLIHAVSLVTGSIVFLPWAGRVSDLFLLIGNAYITIYSAVMLLTPVPCFLRGIIRFLGKRLRWRGRLYRFINHPTKLILCFLLITSLAGSYSVLYGRKIEKTDYTITLEKKNKIRDMSILYLADLYAGSRMTQTELSGLVSQINETKPDLVLLGGNILGRSVSEQTIQKTFDQLQKLSACEGVYLIEGPEDEEILERSVEEIEKRGLRLLRDECIFLPSGIQLAGCRRKDHKDRKALSYTLSLLDPQKPTILLSYDKEEDTIIDKKKMDVLLYCDAGKHYGLRKNGAVNTLGTSGLRSTLLPVNWYVPGEFIHLTLKS